MSASKAGLSKSILEMKFMKKTKEKVMKEADDAEGRAMYASQITSKMLNDPSQFIIESSFVPCENLLDGRYSFHGMNPEIERLLELEEEEKRIKVEDVTKDVSDQDMVKYYSSLAKTIEQKYDKSNRRKLNLPESVDNKNFGKKRRFLKPTED